LPSSAPILARVGQARLGWRSPSPASHSASRVLRGSVPPPPPSAVPLPRFAGEESLGAADAPSLRIRRTIRAPVVTVAGV
jgi:hypothetical protein